MQDIYEIIQELKQAHKPSAIVTVIATKGSTPRETGAKMVVCLDGTIFGTIGGAAVEGMVIEEAKECIGSGKIRRIWHDLDDEAKQDTGMICGGKMEFFIEPLALASRLYIFGGGHVALPLYHFASQVGFSCTIIEDRPEFAGNDRFPLAKEIIMARPEEIIQKIQFTPADFVAIVTRSHELDYQALKAVLPFNLRYIGLIASKIKKRQIFEQLQKESFAKAQINRIHSPIGLDIGARTPEEIAIAIMAEIIQVKNKIMDK